MTAILWSMHGLVVRCHDFLLDARHAPPQAAADLTVRLAGRGRVPSQHDRPAGRVLARIEAGDVVWLSVVERTPQTVTGRLIDVHFHELATATLDMERASVELVFAPDADASYAGVLVSGTVISVVLMLLGHPVLHASAVTAPSQGHQAAVAFFGSSGRGKSTVATLACRDGARLLADDVLRLDVGADSVLAWPGATATRLRPAAAELASESGDPIRLTPDGRTAAQLSLAPDRPLPLDALVLPCPDRESPAVAVERVRGIDAVLTLASHPRILGWQDSATAARAHLHAGELATRIPILRARIPWGPPFREGLGAEVLQAVDDAVCESRVERVVQR